MDARQNPGGADLSGLRIDERARPSGRTGKFLRIFAATVGGLVLLGGAVMAFRSRNPLVQVAPAQAPAEPGTATLLNASGYVTPRRRATVASKITGLVTAVYVDEGVRVEEGQVLARLDDSDARRRLESAKADRQATAATVADLEVNHTDAERELRRTEQLTKEKVASVQALDKARTTVDSLRARMALAKEQVSAADARIAVAQQDLTNTTVRAPFSGMVVSKDAQVGEMVSPVSAGGGFTRTGIATLVDMKSLEIEVDVNESYIARVVPGQKVTARLDAHPDWAIPSKVRIVIPTADRQKATVKVRISFDKLDSRILPDMGVKVAFLAEEKPAQGRSAAQALVPRDAVRYEEGKPFVFLLRQDRLERRAVRLGQESSAGIEIVAGVAPGDQIVVKGPEGLHDGQVVEISR
jgi:RND family efflux transporter MFP subunit